MHLARPSRLDALARHLPFAIDDYGEAAAVYTQWRESGHSEHRRVAVLWGYCYAVRYLTYKFANERTATPSDLDAAIDEAIRRLMDSFEHVRDPSLFPNYVSVLCRRVLLSHRSRRRDLVEVSEDDLQTDDPDPFAHDRPMVHRLVAEAIDRLAPAIAEVVRMKLIERRSYQNIANALDRPIDSVRTYYSKAIYRLREDPDLRALWLDEDLLEGSAENEGEVRSDADGSLEPRSPGPS